MTVFARRFVFAVFAFCAAIVSIGCAANDPLPSWNDADAKRAILDFVEEATDPASDGYIAPEERIATFDNDGTLWPEQPFIQALFARERLGEMARRDASIAEREPYRSALRGDMAALKSQGEEAVVRLLLEVHAGMAQEEFEQRARNYFAQARHPTLDAPITDLAYAPMVELMNHLRDNGFSVYICSGGGADFIRAISDEMYRIAPQNVIGSTLVYEQRDIDGRSTLWRTAELGFFNDKAIKPVNIHERIGRRPALAAGNVKSGGDIEMLRYSQGRDGPSLQIIVNHDDASREFAYAEEDQASLNAAGRNGWIVVSMKNDWNRIFAAPTRPNAGSKDRR